MNATLKRQASTLAIATAAAVLLLSGSAQAAKMYWADAGTGKIQRANLDGSNVEDVVTGQFFPDQVAFDPVEQTVFWTSGLSTFPEYPTRIQRASVDGTGLQDLLSLGDLSVKGGLAVDPLQRKLYGLDLTGEGVFRMDLAGGPTEGSDLSFSNPTAFALDVFGRQVYITNSHGQDIVRFDYDFDRDSGRSICANCGNGYVQSLAIDPVRGYLYYGPMRPPHDELFARVSMDGTGRVLLIEEGLGTVWGLTLDVAGAKLYWTDPTGGVVRRANLDGTNIETLVTGLVDPRGIVLDLLPVPEPSTWLLGLTWIFVAAGGVALRHAVRQRFADP
jgi:sugar lactone lactonase YvrE